jgi:hypothetical protein
MTVNHLPNCFEFSEAYTCREFMMPAIKATDWCDATLDVPKSHDIKYKKLESSCLQI